MPVWRDVRELLQSAAAAAALLTRHRPLAKLVPQDKEDAGRDDTDDDHVVLGFLSADPFHQNVDPRYVSRDLSHHRRGPPEGHPLGPQVVPDLRRLVDDRRGRRLAVPDVAPFPHQVVHARLVDGDAAPPVGADRRPLHQLGPLDLAGVGLAGLFKVPAEVEEDLPVALDEERLADLLGRRLELCRDQVLEGGEAPLDVVAEGGLVFRRRGYRGGGRGRAHHSRFREEQVAGGRIGNRLDELLVPSHLVLEAPLQLGCFPLETIESIHFTASVWMDCAGVDVDVVKAVADAALRGRSVAVVVVVCVVVVVVATAATNDDARSVVIVVAAAAASAC
mmetsp:Transcript_25805/g.55166  ORF Transcript_25805/g.55166 Transcript_25805/m.55166 type:complete len:335 (+) Transcript_25805:259-1263(+)|eukprot:CAMPEP_0201126364 /NCGR_PEP_ID=MMETSP0850-20130426/25793_1 /ASSEMBLY_ACC=CAM_ASM_000622 /TAXON_ID=183588 /ORGANISM="Pseudo-nitzschia fraudulenta, Strain WWA7" /LENGTH=334 /DNA_ID=CAMNT_0047394771 /DNA_START=254 /DNA_END=1258 /DNA_ORIENTATION=-